MSRRPSVESTEHDEKLEKKRRRSLSKESGASKSCWGMAGGLIEQMLPEEEEEHVQCLAHKLKSHDLDKRRKAAEAFAGYIQEQRFLPKPLHPHPAEVIAKIVS